MSTAPQLVAGTAGHIDHGKSRLVFALTGTDPDRFPEEKARGMTIDLGFAHAAVDGCDIWFVDVPGHERFVRHMVAGATGIDVALLVVAADDSVMPQTREHAELLSLLGVDRCVVVLSKMDLVDDEWADQVEQEVRELLATLAIKIVAVVRTSAETGRGLDELRVVLASLARGGSAQREAYRWFRLPIDRAFTVAGRGTVVTGSVAHGAVKREDELELWPAGRRVRVRDLQTHYDQRDSAAGRMRLAVNLANVALDEVQRGCELAAPGYLEAARCLDVWLIRLQKPGKTPRQKLRLRLHMATGEVLAELRLLEPPTNGKTSGFGQLIVSTPVVASWHQHFILRDESGQRTLGGGWVLQPVSRPWRTKRPPNLDTLINLSEGPPPARVEEVIRALEWQGCIDEQLATRAGIPDAASAAELRDHLHKAGQVQRLDGTGGPVWLHIEHLRTLEEILKHRLGAHLEANPRLPGVPYSEWPDWMPRACPQRPRAVLAEWFLRNQRFVLADGFILPKGQRAEMSAEDQALLEAILKEYFDGGFKPPGLDELRGRTPRNQKRVRELIDLAAARGRLVRIDDGLWLHGERWAELARRVANEIRSRGGLTVAEIRTLLDSTRKFVVPIVEHLDAAGVTRRTGDTRVLGPNAPPA